MSDDAAAPKKRGRKPAAEKVEKPEPKKRGKKVSAVLGPYQPK